MISRRDVLCAGAALLLLPSEGCAAYARPVTLYDEPYQTIAVVYADLFPGGGQVPSPHLLKAIDYLGGVLADPYIDEASKRFITNGAGWLNDQAKEEYGKPYYSLDSEKRQTVLRSVSDTTWGGNWLWTLFSYLFEALLSDPVYGANTHEAGWHWLNFIPGYPRPKRAII